MARAPSLEFHTSYMILIFLIYYLKELEDRGTRQILLLLGKGKKKKTKQKTKIHSKTNLTFYKLALAA